jgi:hypothetical protein
LWSKKNTPSFKRECKCKKDFDRTKHWDEIFDAQLG